jgi:tetratricopeptide (TPR) repeat protein
VLAATAVVAALFLGAVASTWQAVRATRAEREQIRLRTEIEAELNRTSGEFFAKHGRWAEAVPFYQKAIELTPNHHEFYHRLLPLLAQAGDLPQYQENCRKALAQFRQTQDPRVAERLTKDCMILPNSLVDSEALSQLADLALAAGPDDIDLPWFQLAKGLAEYRRGRFQSAIDWLQASLAGAAGLSADPGRVYVQAQGRALLALAHHRLGAADQARADLLESRQLIRDRLPPLSIHGLTDYWPDWLYAHILLREAGEFIHSPEPILP